MYLPTVTPSEDSDWSNVPPESLSWPSSMVKMSVSAIQESGVIVTPQDSLNTVLEKVGLTEYQKLFRVRTCMYSSEKKSFVCVQAAPIVCIR